MGEFIGISADNPLYIATYSDDMAYGAASICFPEMFHSFCLEHGEESCVVLPSSTMEMIILSGSSLEECGATPEDLVRIVRSVNDLQVEPIMQLEPAVYQYTLRDDQITLVIREEVL